MSSSVDINIVPSMTISLMIHHLPFSGRLDCEKRIRIGRNQLAFTGKGMVRRWPPHFRQLDLYWVLLKPFACDEKSLGNTHYISSLLYSTSPMSSLVFEKWIAKGALSVSPYHSKTFAWESGCRRFLSSQLRAHRKWTWQDFAQELKNQTYWRV